MMPQREIMKLVRGVFKGLWKRHVANIGLLTTALLRGRRAGVAALGRQLDVDTTPKHAIKRVDRFLGNPRFRLLDAWEALLPWVIGPRKEVVIACDWTKVRQWPVLSASVIYRGRALPILWAVLDLQQLHKSLNSFEHGFFTLLAQLLPRPVKAIVLLDRGFKRVELIRHLERCGFSYVIRSGGNTSIEHPHYHGAMQDLIGERGQWRDMNNVRLRKTRPVPTRVVALWEKDQAEPWYLTTNLSLPARAIARLYGKRFQIEETFRDQKCSRLGFGLSEITMHSPERLETLLLIVALAHLLALFVGAIARQRGLDRGFRANTVQQQATHSDFTLGLYYLWRIHWTLRELIKIRPSESCSLFGG
jgi:DDE family transposase